MSYLTVLVIQIIALNNERTTIDIVSRRMIASVLLAKALGGGWNASPLLSIDDLSGKDDKDRSSTESKRLPADPASVH